MFYKRVVLKNFEKIYKKTPVSESLFDKFAACSFIKKRLRLSYKSVNFGKCLKSHILKKSCERMLMKPSRTSSFVGLHFFFFFDSVKFEKCPTLHNVSNSSTPLLKFIKNIYLCVIPELHSRLQSRIFKLFFQ